MNPTAKTPVPDPMSAKRKFLRGLAAGVTVAAVTGKGLGGEAFADSAVSPESAGTGVRAYKLYTGPDNASHILKGTVNQKDRSDVVAIHFKETAPHSSLDWHQDPEPQFVITLSGTLEFTMRGGQTFVLRPGDVLLAEDNTGSGHKWRLIDDQPWKRAYIVLKPGAKDSFVPDAVEPAHG